MFTYLYSKCVPQTVMVEVELYRGDDGLGQLTNHLDKLNINPHLGRLSPQVAIQACVCLFVCPPETVWN